MYTLLLVYGSLKTLNYSPPMVTSFPIRDMTSSTLTIAPLLLIQIILSFRWVLLHGSVFNTISSSAGWHTYFWIAFVPLIVSIPM